jgi:hypothetical protein
LAQDWTSTLDAASKMMIADPKWIFAKDEYSCTPLHHAERFAHTEAVKWLLDHGADVNAIAYNGFRRDVRLPSPGGFDLGWNPPALQAGAADDGAMTSAPKPLFQRLSPDGRQGRHAEQPS